MKQFLCKCLRLYIRYFPVRKGKIPLLLLFKKLGAYNGVTLVGSIGKHSKASLNLSDWVQQLVYFFGVYEFEKSETRAWVSLVASDSVVLDVGANFGYYSLLAADKYPEIKIVSFEPAPETFELLKFNIALNNFRNIQPVNLGASDSEGEFTLYLSDSTDSGKTSLAVHETFSGKIATVQVVKLDNFVSEQNLSGVSLVKIDVEGNEFSVLRGMTKIIERDKPVIFVELIDSNLFKFNHSVEMVFDFFKSFDYICCEFDKSRKLILIDHPKDIGLAIWIPNDKKSELIEKISAN